MRPNVSRFLIVIAKIVEKPMVPPSAVPLALKRQISAGSKERSWLHNMNLHHLPVVVFAVAVVHHWLPLKIRRSFAFPWGVQTVTQAFDLSFIFMLVRRQYGMRLLMICHSLSYEAPKPDLRSSELINSRFPGHLRVPQMHNCVSYVPGRTFETFRSEDCLPEQ